MAIMNRLLGSMLRSTTKERMVQAPILSRWSSTQASVQMDDSGTDDNERFNGHDMLAPFAAGWQSADLEVFLLWGNEPRLVAAATKQLNTLPFYQSFWNRTTKPSLDLAKELSEMFTATEIAKVFYTNSGSEANDTQVKLVWYYNIALGRPNKKKFIARTKSYHGSTLLSANLSGLSALHQKFDLPVPFVLHTTVLIIGAIIYQVRQRRSSQPDWPITWRILSSKRVLRRLRDFIRIAAFIAEPVMGAGGVIPPPPTYSDKIQAVLKKYDILFIAYEVICAFGRLGTMFGCDKYNIKPDLVSVAKALSSAYIVSPEVSDVIYSQSNKLGSFSHGFTNSGHPVSCAVALEALRIYKERNIVDQVNRIAPKFQDGIKAFSDSPVIGEIRGTGLILGTEFTDNKSPNDPFPPGWGIGAYFGAQCEKHGMLVRVAGDNIMMSPPFIMIPEEVNELISIYGEALKATEERVEELKTKRKSEFAPSE